MGLFKCLTIEIHWRTVYVRNSAEGLSSKVVTNEVTFRTHLQYAKVWN